MKCSVLLIVEALPVLTNSTLRRCYAQLALCTWLLHSGLQHAAATANRMSVAERNLAGLRRGSAGAAPCALLARGTRKRAPDGAVPPRHLAPRRPTLSGAP